MINFVCQIKGGFIIMKVYQVFKFSTTLSGEDWGYLPIDRFFTTSEKANEFVRDNNIEHYYIHEVEVYGNIKNEGIGDNLPRFWSQMYRGYVTWYHGEQKIAQLDIWNHHLYVYIPHIFDFYYKKQKDNREIHCKWVPDNCESIIREAISSILEDRYTEHV